MVVVPRIAEMAIAKAHRVRRLSFEPFSRMHAVNICHIVTERLLNAMR